MKLSLFDAHNHLQDDRILSRSEDLVNTAARAGVVAMVVNGSCESDWAEVAALAGRYSQVIPSFGYHPWYVRERSPNWQQNLQQYLESQPAGVGEIGLDRWIKDYDLADQETVFLWQLRFAAERNLPVSIHCLKTWGRLAELLRSEPRPACGFLLHSYGGPREMIRPLAELGAYFSLPGYFAHARKERQRDVFRQVPLDRLLIETDAPDQLPPADRSEFPLANETTGEPLNHPANLRAIYRFASELLDVPLETLASRVEQNFRCLFGGILRASPSVTAGGSV
jgi:TatD DNase family protein